MLPVGGRKPVDVLALRPAPSGQDAIWGVLRAAGTATAMTVLDVARQARTGERTARSYLTRLAAAGVVAKAGDAPQRFRLARDLGPDTPRYRPDGGRGVQGGARQQIWNALKVHREGGTAEQLARMASVGRGAVTVDPADARHYLGYLHRAGYLVTPAGGEKGRKGRSVYRLARDTGPDAPKIQRVRTVWDPNLREVVWAGEARDEAR